MTEKPNTDATENPNTGTTRPITAHNLQMCAKHAEEALRGAGYSDVSVVMHVSASDLSALVYYSLGSIDGISYEYIPAKQPDELVSKIYKLVKEFGDANNAKLREFRKRMDRLILDARSMGIDFPDGYDPIAEMQDVMKKLSTNILEAPASGD